MYVEIGGIEQWIEICGDNAANPVLLLLHGGPGGSTRMAAAAMKAWEDHFTVVHWDQRGAGRTLMRNGETGCGTLTIERMIADAVEIAEFLVTQLGTNKLVLLGHSWGSVLGTHVSKRRPDLVAAYVGTGQVVNMRRNEEINYRREAAQAHAASNSEAIAALNELGPPPYDDIGSIRVLREWADVLADGTGDDPHPRPPARPTNLTPDDVSALMAGFVFSGVQLFGELIDVDLAALGPDFQVPMFCFMGTHDQQTAIEPAEAWFDGINAPQKAFARLKGCHHFAVMNKPDAFLDLLLEHVLPVLPKTAERAAI